MKKKKYTDFDMAFAIIQSFAICGVKYLDCPIEKIPKLTDDECRELAKKTIFGFSDIRETFKSGGE